jgi:septal ring-binding cell division protein DamX
MRALQDHLIKSFGEGRQVVVLIDEAHAMPVETLEEIRLLSNLEANRNKLLQLVLFGQPELNDVLARPDMRQLKERITHNFGLAPLVRDDISNYLDFRMRAAGYRGPSVFSSPALKMIAQSSLGLTRRINILADKALLAAFSSGTHQIGLKEIQAAIRDCEFSEATYGGKAAKRSQTTLIAVVLGICVLVGIALFAVSRTGSGVPATPSSVPPASGGAVNASSAAIASVEPDRQPSNAASTPSASPPASAAPDPAANAVASSPTVSSPTSTSPDSAKTVPVVAAPSSQPTRPTVGPLTRERLEAGRAWLDQLPDDRWFIQIFATEADRHAEVESLLRRLSSSGIEMTNIYVYYSELSGKPRYGVTYGSYSSSAAASTAMRGLPQTLRINKPYPRQAIRLR